LSVELLNFIFQTVPSYCIKIELIFVYGPCVIMATAELQGTWADHLEEAC
jgi:hypothetical protein